MRRFAASACLFKEVPVGMNLVCDLRLIRAANKEEAVGKYLTETQEQFPDRHARQMPLVLEIEDEG
jgi:hypothetical protein